MLRALANKERALFQMGKDGISENMIMTISDSLEAHELVKISLLNDTLQFALNGVICYCIFGIFPI